MKCALLLIGFSVVVDAFGGSAQQSPPDCSRCIEILPQFIERCNDNNALMTIKKKPTEFDCAVDCPKRTVTVPQAQCTQAAGGFRVKPDKSSDSSEGTTVETLTISDFAAMYPVAPAECASGYMTFSRTTTEVCLDEVPPMANLLLTNGFHPFSVLSRNDVRSAASTDAGGKSFFLEWETSSFTTVTVSFTVTDVRVMENNRLLVNGVDAEGLSYLVACEVSNCAAGSTDPFLAIASLDSYSVSETRRRLISFFFGEAKLLSKEFTPLGCYQDASDRALPNHLNLGSNWSPDECCNRAKLAGYKFCATQWYGECWAGNEGYDKHGTGDGCLTACINSPKEKCGGSFYLSVYATGTKVVAK